ncbi:MAG: radical SAM protein [Candidatus Diapherotrites archaeon]
MRILLLKLKSKADEIIPPIGLGYLATAVRKKHEVGILDALKEDMELEEVVEFIAKNEIQLIGLMFYTMNYAQIRDAVKAIKEKTPAVKIVVGGPHPSARPEETLNEMPEIDYAFVGEAELGFPQIVDALDKENFKENDLKSVASLVWRKGKKIVLNERKIIDNLDELGFPSWDLLKPEIYPYAPHGNFFKQSPMAPMIITRGCPYGCTFCAGHLVSGKRIRYRSLENVMGEIRLLVKEHGIREIHIEDDNYTMNRKFVEDFCNTLIKEKLGITWACPNGMRLDTLDKKLLILMKKSGLYSVSVGIESGSDRILKLVKKSLTTAKTKEKVELINSVGLDVIGFVMLGFPTETKEEMEQTIDFVTTLPLKRINFSYLQPFPGTEIYDDLIKSKKLENVSWENCFLFKASYIPEGFTEEELRKIRQKGLRKFYLRPKILLSILAEMRSPRQFFFALRRGIRWLVIH